MLAVASVSPVYVTSQLDEGILCVWFFYTGKAWLWWGILFLDDRRPTQFFQPSKMPLRGNSLMSCCSNLFDNRH